MQNKLYDWYMGIKKNKTEGSYRPHKPLTLLYALSKIANNQQWIEYSSEREKLEKIIAEFTN